MVGNDVDLETRITDRDGYDNQPMFTGDGKQILFTSDRAGRANTYLYDLDSGSISQLTFTDADKYSPTIVPGSDGKQFSVVHSDSNIVQGLWKYSIDGSIDPAPITNVDNVAYYTWVRENQVLFWRLSTPSTLQLLNVDDSETTVVMEDSAFSFKPHPSEFASTYLAKWDGRHSDIRNFDWETGESTTIASTLSDGRDFAWTPDGRLLMMSGSELHSIRPGQEDSWSFVADLNISNGSRISVSPDGSLLAIVGSRQSVTK
jgi:Tol biopolymer transport system component